MFQNNNYNAQFRALQDKYRKDYDSLLQGAKQQHNQEMQAFQQARSNMGQVNQPNNAPANQPAEPSNVVPPHMQTLAALGEIKAVLDKISGHLIGETKVDPEPNEETKVAKEVEKETKTKKEK